MSQKLMTFSRSGTINPKLYGLGMDVRDEGWRWKKATA